MDDSETNGIKLKSGNLGCPKCGCDQLKLMSPADGNYFYKDYYDCIRCGEVVWIKKKRSRNW